LKKSIVWQSCVSIDSFDYDFLSEKDHAETYAEKEELNENIKKMRLKISNLNYLQREIMVMHYIDDAPIKSISQKLNIPESTVKWHLHDTRKKLKKEIIEMDETNFVYRPGKLHMAISGNPGPAPDAHKINNSLSKQNICLACYREAKTPNELAEMLGIAQAYVEFDLKWLVEKQLMKSENGRYCTMFSIKNHSSWDATFNLFIKNKANFCDAIIEKFMAKQDKIKNINFNGSDQPMEKLLWLFIYKFIDYVSHGVAYEERRYPQPERPIMPDGGQYFPLGFDRFETTKETVKLLDEKYREIDNWSSNGAMQSNAQSGEIFHWMGLYNAGRHTLVKLHSIGDKNYQIKQVLLKTLYEGFSIGDLDDGEKELLGEMISYGWISKKDDKIIHNFCIFTHEQEKALKDVFGEIYEEIKDETYSVFAEIEKLLRADLPKHLAFYANYHIYRTFCNAIPIITGFAYYDGKIYDPKDEAECGLLTFQVVKNN
jgi:DNA-binding CsgD family transcriptional regulator